MERQLDSTRVLRLHIEGAEDLEGDVRLGAFIEKLAALKSALAETEHLISGHGGSTVDFLVSELSHSSPAMVGVRGISLPNSPEHLKLDPGVVLSEFMVFLGRVRARTLEASSSRARLVGHLRKLVGGVGERFERLWVDGPAFEPIYLDADIARALDDALPDVRYEFGTIKGVVKRYSGVGKQPYFKIIPPVGGVEIRCAFPQSMLEEAAQAVERTATVEGELKSYEDDLWPHEVKVRKIDVHKHDRELPYLTNLLGSEPSATGELSAAEFVRAMRSEW